MKKITDSSGFKLGHFILSLENNIFEKKSQGAEDSNRPRGFKSKFESQMHFLLSIFIIMTEITMIISYEVIIYVVSIKRNKTKRTTNKRKRLQSSAWLLEQHLLYSHYHLQLQGLLWA